jgi:hypothetical protein
LVPIKKKKFAHKNFWLRPWLFVIYNYHIEF